MKKIAVFLIVLLTLLIPSVVFADDKPYKVYFVENDGSFTIVESYSDFESAKNKMKENIDYVVINKEISYSPEGIIAMNRGIAYTYPGRSGSPTLLIYERPDKTGKTTYVERHYEMTYLNSNGYMANIIMNGFYGWVDLKNCDLIPQKIVDRGLTINIGGNNNYEDEDVFTIIPVQNYYKLERNGNYTDVVFYFHRAYTSRNSVRIKEYSLSIAPAYNFMKEGVKYYSSDGVNFYVDSGLTQFAGVGYNYYQYLPLRSKTNISGDTLDAYLASNTSTSEMKGTGNYFIKYQDRYGVNALLMYAMAIHESGFGTSWIAVNNHNLFGWGAIDTDPANSASYFSNVKQCIKEMMGINVRGYLDITDWRYFGSHLGNKGSGFNVQYASDPYWGLKIASYAYKIDKFANNNNGNLSDYGKYSLSVVKTFDAKGYNLNGDYIFHTRYGPTYQKDLTVITKKHEDDWMLVQSTNIIDQNGVMYEHTDENGDVYGYLEYNFDNSTAKLLYNDLLTINYEPDFVQVYDHNEILSVSNISVQDGFLNVKGIGAISNLVFEDASSVKQQLVIENLNDGEEYVFDASSNNDEVLYLNDGFDYKNVGFEANIDVHLLNGEYALKIRTTYGDVTRETYVKSVNKKYSSIVNYKDGWAYRITSNQLMNYRIELEVFLSGIDYQQINKPSARTSLFSFDSLSINNDLLEISGQAMIYYLDYATKEASELKIYLINDAGELLSLNVENNACPIDYASILNIKNNAQYICFNGSIDVSQLHGNYKIVATIRQGDYFDSIYLYNRSRRVLGSNSRVQMDTSLSGRIFVKGDDE